MSSVEVEREAQVEGESSEATEDNGKSKVRFDALLARLPKAPAWVSENAAQLQDMRVGLERRFEDSVTSFLASLQVAQTRDIGGLAGQIRDLERRVALLEAARRNEKV